MSHTDDTDSDDDSRDGDFLSILRLHSSDEETEERVLPDGDLPQEEYEKQEEEKEEHHQLQTITASISIRQLRSRGLSFQIWPAAHTLLSALDLTPSLLLPARPARQPRVLELGSGTGLVGIAAAVALSALVTVTDLPHVLPNLQFNADTNAGLITSRGGAVEVRRLRWGEEEDAAAVMGGVGPFDLVLASDVVYYEDLIEPLLRTLRRVVRGETAFVMAHLRRWKKRDATFFRKARKEFDVEVLRRDPPPPGWRVGVVVYRFVEKGRSGSVGSGDGVGLGGACGCADL